MKSELDFIRNAGLRMIFTSSYNLALWRWTWRGQGGRPRDPEGAFKVRARESVALWRGF